MRNVIEKSDNKEKNNSVLFIVLIVVIHTIALLVVQFSIFICFLGCRDYSASEMLIRLAITIPVLCLDYFLCHFLRKKIQAELKRGHRFLIHGLNLILCLPLLLLVLVNTSYRFIDIANGIPGGFNTNELILIIGMLIIDAIIVLERVKLITEQTTAK